MTKRGRKRFAVLAALAVIAGTAGTYAYFSDSIAVNNHISVGDVNIALAEYEQTDGKETVYRNPKQILPGDVISKIPRITNFAEPCWVRVKITFGNSLEGQEGLSAENLSGFPEGWTRIGDYYYYTSILEKAEAVDLFHSVHIPWEWTEAHEGQELAVDIRADAIQAANFKPDFTAMSPWGNQEIQLCVHEENGKTVSRKEKIRLAVEFNGQAHKLISVGDDFFANFGEVLPGDTLADSAEISNTTDQEAVVYFRTALEGQTEEQTDLLKKLGLTIHMGDKLLYSGNVCSEGLRKDISLGRFQPGESGRLSFTVRVPESLGNAYALRSADVKWIFTVREGEVMEVKGVSKDSGTPADSGYGAGGWTGGTSGTPDPVKTGDDSPVSVYMGLLLISLASLAMSIKAVRKGGKKR